jgi:hypothetical protein
MRVARIPHAVALGLQHPAHDGPDVRLIVDDEDRFHGGA